MNRTLSKLLFAAVLPLAAVTSYVPEAHAQAIVVGYPPATYVASYSPVYYNGYAHYYYGNRWWYRDHVGWHNWATEPGYLGGYRAGWGGRRYHWR
jgi:hypothetical protein